MNYRLLASSPTRKFEMLLVLLELVVHKDTNLSVDPLSMRCCGTGKPECNRVAGPRSYLDKLIGLRFNACWRLNNLNIWRGHASLGHGTGQAPKAFSNSRFTSPLWWRWVRYLSSAEW